MKYLTIIFLFFTLNVFSQELIKENESLNRKFPDNSKYIKAARKYLENPKKKDTFCRTAIEKAKSDVSQNKIVFVHRKGQYSFSSRYEAELKLLCQEYGLYYKQYVRSDMIMRGQTSDCYETYMEKTVDEKFGSDFTEFIHKKADSLYIKKILTQNIAIDFWNCDIEPYHPKVERRFRQNFIKIYPSDTSFVNYKSIHGDLPTITLNFIVEKDGSYSELEVNKYSDILDTNPIYRDFLINYAIKEFKNEYSIWSSGSMKGSLVRTKSYVVVKIEK